MKLKNDGVNVQGKSPGFWLYPADLERDLAPLTPEAQCLWIRMLCRMHFARRRGYLEHPSGQPITNDQLARIVGMPKRTVDRLIKEMEACQTFSRDESGIIYNRRMVRDTEINRVRRAAAESRLRDAKRDQHGQFAPAKTPANDPASDPAKEPAKEQQNTVLSDSVSVSVSDSSLSRGLAGEDGFDDFRAAAEAAGMSGSEVDWHEARIWEWRKLSFEQRLSAVAGIRERAARARDDPALKALPKNYLARRMWEREIRSGVVSDRRAEQDRRLRERLREEYGDKVHAV